MSASVMTAPKARETSFDEMVARMLPLDKLNRDIGDIRARYVAGKPFPHVVMDGYWDEAVLDRVAAEFPDRKKRDWLNYDTADEIKQTSRGIMGLSPFVQAFFCQLASEPMLEFLRKVTGIEDMCADPLFHGGGLHESRRGGWLGVHVDWTSHPVLPLTRKANMIIYLNRDWDESWGGGIELFDPVTKKSGAKAAPLFNRAVIFPTRDDTFHGFPDPMTCPENRSRKSASMFYWAPNQDKADKGEWITFLPGKKYTRGKAFVRSLVPPIAFTARDKVKQLLGK